MRRMRDISRRSGVLERVLQFLSLYKFYWISSMIVVLFVFALLIVLGLAAGSAKPFMYTFTH
jgi:uncharacterized membrane protein YhaH (DUF805 family)